MTKIKRKSAQRRVSPVKGPVEFEDDVSCVDLLQPRRAVSDLIEDSRCLSFLLNTSTFDIDGTMYLDRVDDFARGICALSRNSLVAKSHFEYSFYRFEVEFPRDHPHLQARIDKAWNSVGTVFSRGDAVRLLKSCVVYTLFGSISPGLLNYILDEPKPDFLTLNRLHGWGEEMNDPAYFYLAGNGLLRNQVGAVYGL